MLGVIRLQLVECPKGCNRAVKVKLYTKHVQSKCQSFFEHSTYSPSQTTVLKILNKQPDAPTTSIVRKVALRRLMAESPDGNIVQFPTHGQVEI